MSFSGDRDNLIEEIASHFRAASPIAHEIVTRDVLECFDDDDTLPPGSDACSEHEAEHGAGPSAMYLRPSGIAYGPSRPTVAPQSEEYPVPSEREIQESLNAERSLLRDNHLLPPKHRRRGPETSFKAVYRYLFSTKVRYSDDGLEPSLSRVTSKAVETSPLLQHFDENDYSGTITPPSPSPTEVEAQWEAAVAANILQTTWQREAMTLFQYARSLIVTFLLHYSVTVTSVFTVGRIGTLELGAVSLATMTANITCYAPVQGLSTSLDTLCAQAYGSGHKKLVGLQLQRMTYLLWLLLVPISVLWWFSDRILGSIIPDQETASLAGMYLRVLILGTPGVAAFESGKRFVQAQGLFHATTYVLLIGAAINIFANWFFVWHMGWGFAGAGSAVVFTQNLLPVLLFLYVRFVDGAECWNGLTTRAFSNWGPMIKLALPGMIMVEAQYFAFEILTLAASRFGSAHLAAQSVVVTITSTTFNIPFPLAIAASTRVANLIGARLSGAAKTSAKVALVAGCLVGIFNLTLLRSLRFKLPLLFTDDEEVARIVSDVLPICAILQIFDSLAAISHGLLRGIGRQGFGGFTNLFSYYLIALPVSFATAFGLGWQLQGLWIGVTTGLITVGSIELFYLYHADWDKAVIEAEQRLRSDEGWEPGCK